MSRQSTLLAVVVASVLAVSFNQSFAQSSGQDAPKPAAPAPDAATPTPLLVPGAAPEPPKPTLSSVSCKNLKVTASWKGSGVGVVDLYGKGEPVLQVRQDPSPDQTSIDFALGKEWAGRTVDVRIWDKDVKLLDTKSTDCKKP